VNYRTPDDLEGFLASWQACGAADYAELTIVNVAPEERDMEIAEAGVYCASAPSKRATHMWFEENVGYSKACNAAVMDSEADVFAFFNADTRLLPGVLEPLYLNLRTHDDWGVIGPRQVDDRGRIVHAGIMGTNEKPVLRGWFEPDNPGFCDIREDAVSVMGSAYFVKRECWDELNTCPIYRSMHPNAWGALLPTQHYYEETWFSYHARAHGWKVVYYGLAKMIHRWHKASPVGGFADGLMGESQAIFRAMCDAHDIPRD
jgi:GT2 family glycosyltransferase